MGGKVKQRTKGNVKPSSSGRAAELLSRDGATGFLGFGSVGSMPGDNSLQFVPASSDPDTSVHADFIVVMKKLTKRDATTKLKAVQEFGELCKTCAKDAVLGALPYWPRLYNKLAMDVDYRVREAAQHAMNQMSCRVGRNLAPHLRSVMGVWLCSQCDSYVPVATAAQKAFATAFSENKQAEVLGFCKKEIFEYLQDNLINQTADTLGDPDVVEEKDRVTKYIRVISSSLQALGKFVKMVSDDVNTQMCRYQEILTAEKKFWKFGKHKSPQIRAAFFSLVAIYCQKLPDVVKTCSGSVCPIVLGALDEPDAAVSGPLWEAVLQVVNTVEDCWKYVNVEKAVLPRFWHFLSNAAYGNGSVVMVSVLPFISKLPDEVSLTSGFSQKMFCKFVEGLKQPKVQQSPSECKAVVTALMDCMQYMVLGATKRCGASLEDDTVRQGGIHVIEQLIVVIDMSLAPRSQISCTSLYERLGNFLCDLADDDISDCFWNQFDDLIYQKLQRSDTANDGIFQSIVSCLCSLKSPGLLSQKPKSSAKVRFQEPASEGNDEAKIMTHKHKYRWQKEDSEITSAYGKRLSYTLSRILCSSLENVLKENAEFHLVLLAQLLKEFCSPVLLKDLLKALVDLAPQEKFGSDVAGKADYSELSKGFIRMFVLPLLERGSGIKPSGDSKWLLSLVQLLFICMAQVDEDDRKTTLENVFQVNSSPKLLHLIVTEIFEAELFLYLSYIHGQQIGLKVVDHLKNCLTKPDQDTSQGLEYTWRILNLCFSHTHLLDFFFCEDSLHDMFQEFHHTLASNTVVFSKLASIIQVIENFLKNAQLYSAQIEDKYELVSCALEDIIKLKLCGFHDDSNLSRCWNTIANIAVCDEKWLEKVITRASTVIKDHLHSSESTTLKEFGVFTVTAMHIFRSLARENRLRFSGILRQLIPASAEWDGFRSETSLQTLWSIIPFLDGEITFNQSLVFTPASDEDQLTPHQKICLFFGQTLKEILLPSDHAQGELTTHDSEWRIFLGAELLWMRECLRRMPSIRSRNTPGDLLVKHDAHLQPLLDWMASTDCEPILMGQALFNKSQSQGGLWSLTLKSAVNHAQEKRIVPLDGVITACRSGYEQSTLQTLQCLLASDSSIYNLKLIVESYINKWKETDVTDCFGQMFSACLIACAFERWADLTKDSEVGALECRLTLLDVVEDIRRRKETFEQLLLFSCSLDDAHMTVVSFNMALIRLFKLAVMSYSNYITGDQWDMILCSMLDWLQSCQESSLVSFCVSAFTNHVCQLTEAVGRILCKDKSSAVESTSGQQSSAETSLMSAVDGKEKPPMEKLADEWNEFFSNSACGNLLRLWLRMADTDLSDDPALSVCFHHVSEALSAACTYLSADNLKDYAVSSPQPGSSAQAAEPSSWAEQFLREFSPHLESSFSSFQMTSYRLLLKAPPSEIMTVICNGQSRLPAVLNEAEVPFGETLSMADDVEALHISRAYLLAWKLLLSYFVSSSEELRVEYANFLRREKFLNELLEILFRLLPKKPGDGKRLIEGSSRVLEKCLLHEEFVHSLAFETYYDLLRSLPALVRHWWNNLDKKQAAIVEKYTTTYVSPLLCEKEMQTVQRSSANYENMDVITRSSAREVIAYYKIEDISIELIVSLSASHPLGLINVNSGKRVGVKINEWRLWMMQLTTFLMHQNGTIMEGLLLWKRNVDKKFEGVDDCMICFSVIHGSNYSLPKLSCRTCKKKFHSACLYRWFSTSNNSTCPLCRNLF